MYTLFFRERAAKKLSDTNEPYYSLIKNEILSLRRDYFPRGKNCKKLHGKDKDFYRIRIGPYRALYHVNHTEKIITILRILHRGEGY